MLIVILLGAALQSGAVGQATAPAQPIAFSHKTHAGTMKLACKMCHPNPEPGESMTIVPASRCMECHSSIKADSPEIRKLAEYAKSGTPIPWVRVYEIPSFVAFSHRVHLDSGSQCEDCHGPVASRDRLYRETDLSMGGCMSCHKARKATIQCSVCHDLPN